MNLEKYKEYLDIGSFEGLRDIKPELSRYISFKFCLEEMTKRENPSILELGTCRSFVDGKYEGCNLDDIKYWNPNDPSRWDWGGGCFSLIFGQLLKCNLTTIDLIESHVKRCKAMTDSLKITCNHIVSDSVSFLKNTSDKYDLIYIDTGDMWPIQFTEKLQLEESKIIIERGLLKDSGIILIDDVLNKTPRELGDMSNEYGKSTYSLPYLKKSGFKVVFSGYQYVLSK